MRQMAQPSVPQGRRTSAPCPNANRRTTYEWDRHGARIAVASGDQLPAAKKIIVIDHQDWIGKELDWFWSSSWLPFVTALYECRFSIAFHSSIRRSQTAAARLATATASLCRAARSLHSARPG